MRQFPSRYAIRARRNLPDKEIRSIFPSFVNWPYQFVHNRTLTSSFSEELRCLTFGLLLVRFGLCAHFCTQGNYGLGYLTQRLSSHIIVLVRSMYVLLHTPNLRTIIVIADIDRGLYSPAQHINTLHQPYLTFRHWSGVTPYTSSYEFAGSCVFVKQSPGNLSLRPLLLEAGLIPKLRPLFCRVP